jgi:DNA-binding NarL/FixJ family response regulator
VTIRVIVADDQGMVRSGFSILLNAQPDIEVVGEAVNGQEAIARVAELSPDVILMDVRMPVLDGLQATRQITATGNGAPRVLVLTTFDLDDYVYEALRSGASGFLLKDASAGELAEAVRVVAEQTVKTHVSRILMKLALRDRAQAVVFAYESGLVRPGE